MPRPSKTTDTKTAPAQEPARAAEPVAETAPVAAAAAPAKKGRSRAQAVSAEVPVTPAVESAPVESTPAVPVIAEEAPAEEAQGKTRVAPTRESVMTDFAELLNVVETEIERLRESADKNHSAKFLRQIQRRLRSLQSTTARVMRHKAPSARRNNNSGFLKPVNISPEIAKFTGLDAKSQHSRVKVTKYLCNYIKEKNLPNPEDKRQIFPDPALSKLLKYDSATGPLTYYHMQSLLKEHFTKPQAQ